MRTIVRERSGRCRIGCGSGAARELLRAAWRGRHECAVYDAKNLVAAVWKDDTGRWRWFADADFMGADMESLIKAAR